MCKIKYFKKMSFLFFQRKIRFNVQNRPPYSWDVKDQQELQEFTPHANSGHFSESFLWWHELAHVPQECRSSQGGWQPPINIKLVLRLCDSWELPEDTYALVPAFCIWCQWYMFALFPEVAQPISRLWVQEWVSSLIRIEDRANT